METPVESVELPTSLEDAGYYSFSRCESLSRASMPPFCRTDYTFNGCDKLLAMQDAEYTATEMSFELLSNISWATTGQVDLVVRPRYCKTLYSAGTDGRFYIPKSAFVTSKGEPAPAEDTAAWSLDVYGPGTTLCSFKIEWNLTGGCADAVLTENDGPLEWYNLQGVRVDNPTSGVYLRRQGNEARKVLVR